MKKTLSLTSFSLRNYAYRPLKFSATVQKIESIYNKAATVDAKLIAGVAVNLKNLPRLNFLFFFISGSRITPINHPSSSIQSSRKKKPNWFLAKEKKVEFYRCTAVKSAGLSCLDLIGFLDF